MNNNKLFNQWIDIKNVIVFMMVFIIKINVLNIMNKRLKFIV